MEDIANIQSSREEVLDLINSFDQLETQSSEAITLIKNLIKLSSEIAISTTVEYADELNKDSEYIELAKELWQMAEKCTQCSIQISILRKMIISKAKVKMILPNDN